jgi:hypothetical protein
MLLCNLARHVEGLICRSGIIPNHRVCSRIGDGHRFRDVFCGDTRVLGPSLGRQPQENRPPHVTVQCRNGVVDALAIWPDCRGYCPLRAVTGVAWLLMSIFITTLSCGSFLILYTPRFQAHGSQVKPDTKADLRSVIGAIKSDSFGGRVRSDFTSLTRVTILEFHISVASS